MNDMNRLLIFLLLSGLLFALYKYQHLIFGQNKLLDDDNKTIKLNETPSAKLINHISNKNNKLKYEPNNNKKYNVDIDNVSQLSLGSLDDENGSPHIYKQDSILGSDSESLLTMNTNGSNCSNNSRASKNSSFFF